MTQEIEVQRHHAEGMYRYGSSYAVDVPESDVRIVIYQDAGFILAQAILALIRDTGRRAAAIIGGFSDG